MQILIFDFDSTLIRDEGLDVLFEASLRLLDDAGERAARVEAFRTITDQGMAGEIPFSEALSRRMRLLRADRALVREVGEELAGRLTPSVARHAGFFAERSGSVHIISGGFVELIAPTAERLGIARERVHSHRFDYDERGIIRGVEPGTALARGGKPLAIRELGLDPARTWVVGDGATDAELRTVGLAHRFVAFVENRRREPVVEMADHVAESMDDLLALLARDASQGG
jgi:D-3-phosphoglycerate dehydrogenase / 2-oxoglutarate reductase